MSLLANATAIRVQHWEAALATIGFDIGHTRSAALASKSAHTQQSALVHLSEDTVHHFKQAAQIYALFTMKTQQILISKAPHCFQLNTIKTIKF